MPDITMCGTITCPIRETCFRYKAEPNKGKQSYFLKTPYDFQKERCDHYWKIEKQ